MDARGGEKKRIKVEFQGTRDLLHIDTTRSV